MNQGPNRLLDEFAKLMTDAAGVAQGFRREAETVLRAQAERLVAEMDLVKRDDFEAIRELAANARAENESLAARVETLEARIAAIEGGSKGKSPAGTGKKQG
jgi:BMFP domain-containing protein YqiC